MNLVDKLTTRKATAMEKHQIGVELTVKGRISTAMARKCAIQRKEDAQRPILVLRDRDG